MIDEATLRRVVREEISRLLPKALVKREVLSVPACARLYGTSVRAIRDLIRQGSLEAMYHEGGRCGTGRGRYTITSAAAQRHPKLGGGL